MAEPKDTPLKVMKPRETRFCGGHLNNWEVTLHLIGQFFVCCEKVVSVNNENIIREIDTGHIT
jgi:hypothetical protein